MKTKGLLAVAEAGEWKRFRRIVNGGTNGLEQFLKIIGRLS